MDSWDDTREAKRASGAAAGGDVDFISGLNEDVLLRILELAGDTRDAMRTCVLSRRWLGLWKRIPSLRFTSGWPAAAAAASSSACSAAAAAAEADREAAMKRLYVSLIKDILAERFDDPESLEHYHVSSLNEFYAKITRSTSPAVSMVPGLAYQRCDALELSALQQFVSGVNGILARRSTQSDCAVESLAISYATGTHLRRRPHNLKHLEPAFVDAAQGWIQHAFRRHGLKSLVMDLHGLRCFHVVAGSLIPVELRYEEEAEDEEQGGKTRPMVLLGELPDPPPVTMETMHLALGGASVRLPAANATAMKFASLVDLSLEKMMITNGGARLLACLVSPANCPHLQKLRLNQIRLPDDEDSEFSGEEMKIESSILSELWIEHVNLRTSLELTAPGLRIFHIDHCRVEKLTISAPRLEQLAFFHLGHAPRCLEVDSELPCVHSLKICLRAYRGSNPSSYSAVGLTAANGINVCLLNQCISATSLDVTLKDHQKSEKDVDMITSMVPQLPQVTSLAVNVSGNAFDGTHDFGTSVASILTRFTNLRNLNLHLPRFYNKQMDPVTYYPDHLISMAHLKRVELTGLSATELWFVKAMLACAKGLCMMIVSFTAECWKQEHKMAAYKRMLHDEGMTTSHSGGFRLTCRKQSTHA